MIDLKMLELSVYEDIPHLLVPVVTDPKQAVAVLNNIVELMERALPADEAAAACATSTATTG